MTSKEIVAFEIYKFRERNGMASNPDRDWRMADTYMKKSRPDFLSIGQEETMFDRWVRAYFNENGWY